MNKLFNIAGSASLTGLLAFASVASAAVDQNALTTSVNAINAPSGGCDVVNLQGAFASGFLSIVEGQTVFATWIDPTGSGGAGDPGCGGTFTDQVFNLNNVNFTISDATSFGSPGGETGIGTTTYTVAAFAAATPGDLTSGPGAQLGSLQQVLNMNGSGVYSVDVPLAISTDAPFFVTIRFDDFNPDTEIATPLWDAVARPLGRQWVSSDNSGTWVDFTDFFTGGGTGWIGVTASGDFAAAGGGDTPLGPTRELPTLGQWSMLLGVFGLAMLGMFGLRRRSRR